MKFDVKFGVVYKGEGSGGGSDKNYIYKQTEAKDVWVINHDLEKYPSVIIVDDNNIVIVGEIEYMNKNQVIIRFNKNKTGKAILN
ncbi:hypothetical protein [Fusobacterium ulcerans]|uniref:hypothetical protein n=1 Tax=Fusobacterium ulcerans TaxID=861 RepID=UPI003FF0BB92